VAFFGLFDTDDQAEGMAAFTQKRPPAWSDADPSAREKEDAWIESPRAGATSVATMSVTSATRRPPTIRDSAPDYLAPIDASAPVSGHSPAPAHAMSPADAPEQDWSVARGLLYPAFRPVGTLGLAVDSIDREQLAAHSAQSHAQPLLDVGPAGLPVVYTIDAGAYDIVVNGDHLLSWGVEPSDIQDAALRNLATWSATAPWTDEVSGDRRLISSDTGTAGMPPGSCFPRSSRT
jgi:hypothetical protein